MLFFKKNKIKLSLIEDYIQLLVIKNFFNNDFSFLGPSTLNTHLFLNTKNLYTLLYSEFNTTLERLKLNDLSLMILKKELKDVNYLYRNEETQNFSTINETLEKLYNKLNSILQNLIKKQKALNITPFEKAL